VPHAAPRFLPRPWAGRAAPSPLAPVAGPAVVAEASPYFTRAVISHPWSLDQVERSKARILRLRRRGLVRLGRCPSEDEPAGRARERSSFPARRAERGRGAG
jgi:hypothetical protein